LQIHFRQIENDSVAAQARWRARRRANAAVTTKCAPRDEIETLGGIIYSR
jgi:hypothetical protein